MSIQEVRRVAEAVSQDARLREALERSSDVESLIATAAREGYDFTEEELRAAVQTTIQGSEKLSDQQLESVSGGGSGFNLGQAPGFTNLPAVQKLRGILIGL